MLALVCLMWVVVQRCQQLRLQSKCYDVSSKMDRTEFERKRRWPTQNLPAGSACRHKISHDDRRLGRDSNQASWIQFHSSRDKAGCLSASHRSCSCLKTFYHSCRTCGIGPKYNIERRLGSDVEGMSCGQI